MIYRSDRQIVEQMLPVRLFETVIKHGIDDPSGPVAKELVSLLTEAEQDVLAGVDERKANQLRRRSWRLNEVIVADFRSEKAHVAKFALAAFYVLDNVRRHGRLFFTEGGALDQAISAVLAEDGTVSEFANVEAIDNSAQKRARKMFAAIQSEGLFPGMAWG